MQQCKDHAENIADKINPNENYGGKKRPRNLIVNRAWAGRICEVAARKFLKEQHGVEMENTFDEQFDKVDKDLVSVINKRIVEVKCSSQRAKWLLVPWDDIQNKQRYFAEPNVYLMCKVFWDKNQPTENVEVVGYATSKQMRGHYPGSKDFRQGDLIPDTNEKFHNNNIGRHVSNLHTNWEALSRFLKEKVNE